MDATLVASPPPQQPTIQKRAPATNSEAVVRQPTSWRMPPRAIAWRLFFTCWIVYALHFATDVVREHYPAIALGDHFSFRLDEYAGLHPDLFEKPGYGWHIGNNPGVSILAAIPYALARPVIDPLVASVKERRAASGLTDPPEFMTPRPNARKFFAESWRRGLDIKLGLAALVTHALFMVPSSALGVVFMFFALRAVFASDRRALWLSLLYAFGTPVFFRTGFLNHNLMLGHIAFMGFLAIWNPLRSPRVSSERRYLLAGLAGGTALLFDYSGVIFLLGIFGYGAVKRWRESSPRDAVRHSAMYVVGTLPPVVVLLFYQWRSFGNAFFPGQHWMPPVRWIELGYQGYGGPQLELLYALAFDHRFGLFMAAPVLLLALACPWANRGERRVLPALEELVCLALFIVLWMFFSGSNYTRLQWNTGVRYMTPILPFIFLPAAIVLVRMRLRAVYVISLFSFILAWCMAMNREVWRPLGVLEPIARILVGGFELPALTTLSRMPGMFGTYVGDGVSPLPLFILAGAVIYLIWWGRLGSAGARGAR
ncbi:MAG: hypothetical protein ABR543_11440 [Gemmatimonadaceae bacterium]